MVEEDVYKFWHSKGCFYRNDRSSQNGNLQTNYRGGAGHLKEAGTNIKSIIENQTSLENRLNMKVNGRSFVQVVKDNSNEN